VYTGLENLRYIVCKLKRKSVKAMFMNIFVNDKLKDIVKNKGTFTNELMHLWGGGGTDLRKITFKIGGL
jgi:hypothetical protein